MHDIVCLWVGLSDTCCKRTSLGRREWVQLMGRLGDSIRGAGWTATRHPCVQQHCATHYAPRVNLSTLSATHVLPGFAYAITIFRFRWVFRPLFILYLFIHNPSLLGSFMKVVELYYIYGNVFFWIFLIKYRPKLVKTNFLTVVGGFRTSTFEVIQLWVLVVRCKKLWTTNFSF